MLTLALSIWTLVHRTFGGATRISDINIPDVFPYSSREFVFQVCIQIKTAQVVIDTCIPAGRPKWVMGIRN